MLLLLFLANPQIEMPFCICWANENWSRRWDGSENEILVQQVHNEQTDEDFIHDVIPLFKDSRYIKINSAPLLIVYRISLMPSPSQTAKVWREICAANGIPEIYLCIAETFGSNDPRPYGFNAAVQFPPHGMVAGLENDNIEDLAEGYTGKIYDFKNVIQYELARELPTYKQFPGVMLAWDNTARKKKSGNVFINSSPEAYEIWLRGAIDRVKQTLPEDEQFVFINAWNEWAEGTHLEPDQKNGRGYLEATRRALMGNSDWHTVLDYAEQLPELASEAKKHFLSDIRFALERLTKVNTLLLSIDIPNFVATMRSGLPYSFVGLKHLESGVGTLERLNHYHYPFTQTGYSSRIKNR
ncbi:MAG: glycoside hydrolase family 99-like domain-containing protein [Methylococcales bacterium]|nr:glycoside hydrolase family 99-like domain-containing protein [Methylococcales bacterium]